MKKYEVSIIKTKLLNFIMNTNSNTVNSDKIQAVQN